MDEAHALKNRSAQRTTRLRRWPALPALLSRLPASHCRGPTAAAHRLPMPNWLACRVANASRRRVMMTGTPLQNDLNELQNLLHFLLPMVFQELEGDQDLAAMLQVQATPPPHSRRACVARQHNPGRWAGTPGPCATRPARAPEHHTQTHTIDVCCRTRRRSRS